MRTTRVLAMLFCGLLVASGVLTLAPSPADAATKKVVKVYRHGVLKAKGTYNPSENRLCVTLLHSGKGADAEADLQRTLTSGGVGQMDFTSNGKYRCMSFSNADLRAYGLRNGRRAYLVVRHFTASGSGAEAHLRITL